MPCVKGSVALFASITLHTLFSLSASHDLPREMDSVLMSPVPSSPRSFENTAWIANLHHSSSCSRALQLRLSDAGGDLAPRYRDRWRSTSQNTLGCRPYSRRRRRVSGGESYQPLCVAGIEGVGLPSPSTPTAPSSSSTGDQQHHQQQQQQQQQQQPQHQVVADEGDLIYRQLEGKISTKVELAGEMFRFRVARLDEYLAIADVRFDVFSPDNATLGQHFRQRSFATMVDRRRRGAFCLVAVLENLERGAAVSTVTGRVGYDVGDTEGGAAQGSGNGGPNGHDRRKPNGDTNGLVWETADEQNVLGTLECSKHEFDNTPLEVTGDVRNGVPRLYLTEVAVRSACRRLGIGRHLLALVDDVARILRTSEIYLFVNEANQAAVNLYTRCGYEDAPDSASNRAFTNSLGLSEGFIGERHRLLRKQYDVDTLPGGGGTGSAVTE